jgi:hypothetical protein
VALQEGFELGPVEILRLAQHTFTIGRLFVGSKPDPDSDFTSRARCQDDHLVWVPA